MSFQVAARRTLADSQLRRNVGKATSTIRAKRAKAVAEVPDWEALREAGSAIKARAMATLPEQLERLEASVTRAGGVVHWARDAAEANRIVAGIAHDHGARQVIKVKSLATDEIGLNDALAEQGIDLVELEGARECCGFGGVFAVKNADTSMAMLSDKLRHVLDTGAEICTSADNSCLMHIGGALKRQRTGVRTVHLAEILAARE